MLIALAPDEHVELLTRKHWFVLFVELFGYALLWILPFAAYPFLQGTQVPVGAEQAVTLALAPALVVFLGSAWSLLLWMRMVGTWTDYYLDMWIVTNKRIMDIEQKGLFHRKTSIFRIERIQDVTIETKGIIATLLNFGDIHVQTAGEAQEFVMRGIARPRHVREVILHQHDRVTDVASRGNTDQRSADTAS